MVASDERERWPGRVLADPRVRHFWDEERLVGTWFGQLESANEPGAVLWDAYYLYPPGVRWADGPGKAVSVGCPIVDSREELRRDLLAMAEPQAKGSRKPR